VSANCKISRIHDFVKVLPNHSLDERTIDDVENEALISAFLAEKVDPQHEFTPSLRAIHGGSFQGCTAPGDKYKHCNDVVFPTSGVADAIVIVSDELDMTGVGEQLRTLEQSDTGAFVREVWKIMRTVVRLSKDYSFMHNDLHANNIVFNKATGSLYMIDFGRSVINLRGWDRAQLILDDLMKITSIGTTPTTVRKRVGAETGLHWIPTPARMPRSCLWAADICMFSMNLLQSYLQTRDEPAVLSLPFATLTLQQETHAPYGDDAWDTPKREIRVHLPPDIKTSDDVLEAATQVLRNNDFVGTERAVVSVTLVGAAIAAIMMSHKPDHERLFFGESSQIDRAPDLTPSERNGVTALWELAGSNADDWEDDMHGGGSDPCIPHGQQMLASFFPTSMAEAYASKPPLARGQPEYEMDATSAYSTFTQVPMVTGSRPPMDIGFRPSQFSPVSIAGGAERTSRRSTGTRRVHKETNDATTKHIGIVAALLMAVTLL
jgi:hypothetical protein